MEDDLNKRMEKTIRQTMLSYIAGSIISSSRAAREIMMDREVVMLTGKYKGRKGIVRSAIPDQRNGMLYLVYVYRKGTDIPLNSDAQSRQYWPLASFEVV